MSEGDAGGGAAGESPGEQAPGEGRCLAAG